MTAPAQKPASRPKDATDRVIDTLLHSPVNRVDGFLALTPEQTRARNRRNLILGLSIAAFMILVFTITLVRLQAGILERPL